MNDSDFFAPIREIDVRFRGQKHELYKTPTYSADKYYKIIGESKYFHALTIVRHLIKKTSDYYWSDIQGAYNVDLYMLTSSVSSPMGPGSDSEAIGFRFGGLDAFLTDSSQFGFEPLLMNDFDALYCYLPSMRGEDPDHRHLNQFFHCEAEIVGGLHDLYQPIEEYIKYLAKTLLSAPNIVSLISDAPELTVERLAALQSVNSLERISFDDAVNLLKKHGHVGLLNENQHGIDLSSDGEVVLGKIIGTKLPFWIEGYDRNRVPFYQKPDPKNPDKVLNADLICPPLYESALGGEVLGCGQRQDSEREMRDSLERQGLVADPYEWYIALRNEPTYRATSGFGLGIERFIAWTLGKQHIRDVALYPRLKGVITNP